MGAVEKSRKAIQDFLAPEIRSITAKLEALFAEQAQLRSDLSAMDNRQRSELVGVKSDLRAEIIASESRVTAAIERLRSDMPLLIRNAVLEQLLTEKQRVIDDLQRQTH